MPRRLTYPLPRRASTPTDCGWTSHPWRMDEVSHAVLQGGGRFSRTGQHDFESHKVAAFAFECTDFMDALQNV